MSTARTKESDCSRHVTSDLLSLGYLIHPENAIELARRLDLDILLFKRAGTIFPAGFSPSPDAQILDLACGPGGWAFEIAHAFPMISLTGVDHNKDVVDYAGAHAHVLGIDGRVCFQQRDLSRWIADAQHATCDFLHAAFLSRCLLLEQWPQVLADCLRIMRPGAMIQCLESGDVYMTSSAFDVLKHLIVLAEVKRRDGNDSHLAATEMITHLKCWMQQAGYQKISERLIPVNFSRGEEDFHSMFKQWRVHIKLLQPLVVGMGIATGEEYETLYDQMILEMMHPDFCGTWNAVEVCGCKE